MNIKVLNEKAVNPSKKRKKTDIGSYFNINFFIKIKSGYPFNKFYILIIILSFHQNHKTVTNPDFKPNLPELREKFNTL